MADYTGLQFDNWPEPDPPWFEGVMLVGFWLGMRQFFHTDLQAFFFWAIECFGLSFYHVLCVYFNLIFVALWSFGFFCPAPCPSSWVFVGAFWAVFLVFVLLILWVFLPLGLRAELRPLTVFTHPLGP